MTHFKKWLSASSIRAIKTFAQTAVGLLTVGQAMADIDWKFIISVACVSAITSLLTSVAGLPELKDDDE